MKLTREYYLQEDVVSLAKDLLGKVIYTNIEGSICAGIITETEAYAGVNDRASHAYNNRLTERTKIMYMIGGTAYVYLCYGIHYLFNIVTNRINIPHAVLIRSILPYEGIDLMLKRRNLKKFDLKKFSGPGNVTRSLGIDISQNGIDLCDSDEIWIEDHQIRVHDDNILVTPRIGVDYAGEDAKLPYRFVVKNAATLSRSSKYRKILK